MTATMNMVPLAQIRPSKANPRAEFDHERMAELIESVKRHGIISPLTLSREDPVLDSAQRVRGDLPFACKGGVCGTCRARVTEGEVHMRRNYALEAAEVEAGYVLTCQSLPVSDTLTVDFDA